MTRYVYAYGYETREAAQDALDDEVAAQQVSKAESPRVQAYTTKDGRRYQITCEG